MDSQLQAFYEEDPGFAQFVNRHGYVASSPEVRKAYRRWEADMMLDKLEEVFQMLIKKYFIFFLVLTLCFSAVAIQASAAETYYTVTFNSNGGSPVEEQRVLAGEKAVRPEHPTFPGHSFLHWQWGEADVAFGFMEATYEDTNLIAIWLENDDWESPYTDVPYVVGVGGGDFFFELNPIYSVVKWATVNNLVNGVPPTTFAPDANLTRAMFVTILYRYENPANTESAAHFVDVPATAWFADSVAWGTANGIINGIDSHHFAPNQTLNMEEMLVLLYRYALYKGMASSFVNNEVQFENDDAISPWAREAYKKMAAKYGVGFADLPSEGGIGSLPHANPSRQVTRIEVCFLFNRFDEGRSTE